MPTLTTLSCQLWSTVISMLEARLFQYQICIDMTIILTMYTAPTKFNLYSLFPGSKYVHGSVSVSLYMGLFGFFSVLFGVFSVLLSVFSVSFPGFPRSWKSHGKWLVMEKSWKIIGHGKVMEFSRSWKKSWKTKIWANLFCRFCRTSCLKEFLNFQ